MPLAIHPRRSVLYMPGSNTRALEKAKSLPADTVIFDLEDAIAPDMKETAREQVRSAVQFGGYDKTEVVIRMNGLETDWGEEDLFAAIAARPNAILVPKVNRADDVRRIAAAFSASDLEDVAIWAMMETPLAMLNAGEIAAASQDADIPLAAFVLGTNDLAKETGARLTPGREVLLPWLMTCVAAARAYGLAVIDGVFNDFNDETGLRMECEQGRDCGMDGKTLIHPNQIATANGVFAPSEDDVASARAIIDAFALPENADKGAITVNGRMAERLHLEMAEKTIAVAAAIAAAGR